MSIPADVGYWSLIRTNEPHETIDWWDNQSSRNITQAQADRDAASRARRIAAQMRTIC